MDERQNPEWRLGEILIRNHWITWEHLEQAIEDQRTTKRLIGAILVEKGFVSRKNLYRALAIQAKMTFVDFEKILIPAEIVRLIPKEFAYQFQVMPLIHSDGVLLVAVGDPLHAWVVSEIRKWVPQSQIRAVLACPEDVEAALRRYYGPE